VEQPRHGAGVHEAHPVEEVALREHAACAPRASPFLCSSGWPRIASRRGPPRRAECRPPAAGPKGSSVRLTTHRCLLPLCSRSIDHLHSSSPSRMSPSATSPPGTAATASFSSASPPSRRLSCPLRSRRTSGRGGEPASTRAVAARLPTRGDEPASQLVRRPAGRVP